MSRRGGSGTAAPALAEAARWHDVECAAYSADVPLWRELGATRGGPILELGAGTGRVALDLAELGHEVTALDSDPELVRELASRARARGLHVRAETGDARAFALGRRFALVVAPMQVVQLLGGWRGRREMLRCVRRHLAERGLAALAIADPLEGLPAADAVPPLPDVREFGGWVYSSRPVAMHEERGVIAIERLREAVSPSGELRQSAARILLDRVDASELSALGVREGLRELPPRSVPPTESYVGSRVVMLEAA